MSSLIRFATSKSIFARFNRVYVATLPLEFIEHLFEVLNYSLVQSIQRLSANTREADFQSGSYSQRFAKVSSELLSRLSMRYSPEERRKNPEDDLISALVQAEEAGDKLSKDEVLGTLFLLLIAGHETTVNLIGNGMLALLRHPDQLQKLRDDHSLIKAAIEELLRYDTPFEISSERFAREDVRLGETVIPKGEVVMAVIAAANRDPERFPEPNTLDITRKDNKHLAFGKGIHFCLGVMLARMEGQIAIGTLLRRMPNLQLKG